MRKAKYAVTAVCAVLAVCTLFSGCRDDTAAESEIHIISNGVIINGETENTEGFQKPYSADFYIPEGMETDYYRKTFLTDEELEIYNETVDNLGRFKTGFTMPLDLMKYQTILDIIRLEQLSYCQVSKRWSELAPNTQEFDVFFTYRFTADEISSMNMASEKAAKEIMAQLTPDMDDYEKLKFFHDTLILNCETDTEDKYADTVYGALVRKKALCEGYTKAFSYLCNLAGIENVIVTGHTTADHMWNMVKLDGEWYHVDVTWDKPNDSLHKEFPDVILYQYFMVTDSVIRNNHEIYSYPAEPPKAYGTEHNYFAREGADITADGELLDAAESAIMGAVRRKDTSAMVKFATTDLYLSSLADITNNDLFTPVIERVKTEFGEDIRLRWTDYYAKYRIITFIIDYK